MSGPIPSLLFDALHLLAWQDGAAGGQAGGGQAGGGSAFMQQLLHPMNLLLLSMILFFLLVMRPQRAEMKKLQQRLAALKKNDRVVTSGGIHGVIVQAAANEPTVVIRVDENSGARITVNRDAIAKVLSEATEQDK